MKGRRCDGFCWYIAELKVFVCVLNGFVLLV